MEQIKFTPYNVTNTASGGDIKRGVHHVLEDMASDGFAPDLLVSEMGTCTFIEDGEKAYAAYIKYNIDPEVCHKKSAQEDAGKFADMFPYIVRDVYGSAGWVCRMHPHVYLHPTNYSCAEDAQAMGKDETVTVIVVWSDESIVPS